MLFCQIGRETFSGASDFEQSPPDVLRRHRRRQQLVQPRINLLELVTAKLWQFRDDFLSTHAGILPLMSLGVNQGSLALFLETPRR
jgi:hypothetical protein